MRGLYVALTRYQAVRLRGLSPSERIEKPSQWAYDVVVSMFDFHRSDRGSNPGRGGKIS